MKNGRRGAIVSRKILLKSLKLLFAEMLLEVISGEHSSLTISHYCRYLSVPLLEDIEGLTQVTIKEKYNWRWNYILKVFL